MATEFRDDDPIGNRNSLCVCVSLCLKMKSVICFYQHVLIIFAIILQVAQLFLHLPLVDKTDIPAPNSRY